jgi:hypothetical protein
MPEPDTIEAALARLMPVAVSQAGQRSIEDELDRLAAGASRNHSATRRSFTRWGIAAAVVAGSFGLFSFQYAFRSGGVPTSAAATQGGIEWVGEADRLESMSDEGRVTGMDGSALRAVRLRVVGEHMLRDEATGCTVRISEPRDELLLTPVSSF